MEPADPAQLQLKLGQQDAMLESQQQQQLLADMQCVQMMTHQKSFYCGPGGTPQPGSLDRVCSCTHGFGFSATSTGTQPGHPQTSSTTTGEVRWVPRGLQELPHSVATDLQPPTQFLPDRRRQSGIHCHATDGQGRRSRELLLGVLSSPAPSHHGVLCRRCTASPIAP